VQEFVAGHVIETCLFCAAKSYPGDQAVPYLALSEALDWLVSAGLIPDIAPVWLAEVAQVVRQLQVVRPEVPPNPVIEMEHAPARRFQGLTEFITALASEKTLVLWLDDLQWVDEVTFDYLRHLLTRGREARVLVVGTYRPEEISPDHPLAELKPTLFREDLLTEISLPPLTEQDVSQMVADLTGLDSDLWPLGRRVYREIGGIPFFITEQIKLLQEEGWLNTSQWDKIPLSRRLQELIRRRYQRLDESASQFMRIAMIVGARFDFDVVSLAGKLDEEAALDALDRLLDAGLVRKRGTSEYNFWHDQARVVLYEDLRAEVSTEHWQRWHQRVGEAIEALHPGDAQREAWLEQLAHYYCEAEIWPKALTYLLQAGQKALGLFAHKSARGYFERAEKLMAQVAVEPTLAQQVTCAEGLGDACTHLGLFDLALPRYQQAVGLTETKDTSVARLGWKIARVYERQSKFNLAVKWLERSLLVLDQASETEVEARVHWLRGLIEVRRGHPEAALTWAKEALRLSKEASEMPSAQEMPPASRASPVTGIVEEAQANNLMGAVLRARGELAKAADHCTRSAELYETLGHQRGMATAYANLATIAFEQEHWPEAEGAYKRALAVHQDTGNRYGEALVLCNLADTYCHQGRLEEAKACVQAGLHLATETLEVPFLQVLAHETSGVIYLAQDDDEAAYQHLTTGLRLAETHDIREWLVLIQIPLAEIHLRHGRPGEARRAAEVALEQAVEQGSRVKEGVARRMLGRIYQAQGLLGQAEAELQASLGLVTGKDQRYELARTLVALAALYIEDRTKIGEGQAMVQQAIDIFQELGAVLDLANAQALRQRYELATLDGWANHQRRVLR
jgi:tetratricopeptide (TPR) repeat protein